MQINSVQYTVTTDTLEDFKKGTQELQEKHPDLMQSNVSVSRRVMKYGDSPDEDVYDTKFSGSVTFRS